MARSVYTALSFAVLLAVVDLGSCLRCYQCNSQSSQECRDPFVPSNNAPLIDCNTSGSLSYNRQYLTSLLPGNLLASVENAPRSCVKIVLESGTTVRTCIDASPTNPNKNCEIIQSTANIVGGSNKVKHCSSCDKDACNAAGSITASFPVALVALVASYLYYKQ